MKTAKLGAIFLISILALAGIGMGYASWTDTITIDGKVNTGSVEWHFTADSGTWVYKIHDHPDLTAWGYEIYVDYAGLTLAEIEDMFSGYKVELIAYSEAVIDPNDDHHATVTYSNLFPCIEFEADVTILYTGTVPGKINDIEFIDLWTNDPDDTDREEELIDSCTILTITINGVTIDPAILPGYQLHENDVIHVVMTIHLKQDPSLMNLFGDFDVSVEVIQWNKY